MRKYDVVVIGSGPAGLFAVNEILDSGLKILIIEKGEVRRLNDKKASPNCGFGGAGSFSDGKLILTSEVGGHLNEIMAEDDFENVMQKMTDIYMSNAQNTSNIRNFECEEQDKIKELQYKAIVNDMKLYSYKLKHFGTDNLFYIIENLREKFVNAGVDIITEYEANKIEKTNSGFVINDEIESKYVIAVPGRQGAKWLSEQAAQLGLEMSDNGIDIGVRTEVKSEVLQEITKLLYEGKFVYRTKELGDMCRTFCMCENGFVSVEDYNGLKTVNGHSFANKKSNNTNFSILVSMKMTAPFSDPYTYGKNISELSNLLGDPVIVQRLGDLRMGRRSTEQRINLNSAFIKPTLKATPGDLSLVLPYRILRDIMEFLAQLDKVVPGINSDHTLLYGVEVKFYSKKIKINNDFSTDIKNFYVGGDGSGWTRGLSQASMMGIMIGKNIKDNIRKRV